MLIKTGDVFIVIESHCCYMMLYTMAIYDLNSFDLEVKFITF